MDQKTEDRIHPSEIKNIFHGAGKTEGRFLWLLVASTSLLLCSGLFAYDFGGGTGEPNDPYLIFTAEQMNEIGLHREIWDKHFKLMEDIDLSGYAGTEFNIIGNGYPGFTGVFDGNGHTIANFSYSSKEGGFGFGLFREIGGDASIRNLGLINPTVNVDASRAVGSLVGWVIGGTVVHCYAVDVNVTGEDIVGGLVGNMSGVIADSYATGVVTGVQIVGGLVAETDDLTRIARSHYVGSVVGNWIVGGLVGSNVDSVAQCSAIVNLSAQRYAGGLIGVSDGPVANCFSQGTVDAENEAGGLIGSNRNIVTTSYSSASVNGQDRVGGLVGENHGLIKLSYVSASIKGRDKVGGLAGYNGYSWVTYNDFQGEIVDCYAQGQVSGRSYVGGLVGNNDLVVSAGRAAPGPVYIGKVHTSYATAFVSGEKNVGGLVGDDEGGGVQDSFWDTQISSQADSPSGLGLTTAELQMKPTFSGADWDFAYTWTICEGTDYPRLQWEGITCGNLNEEPQARIIYIDDDAPKGGDGLSWETAFQNFIFPENTGEIHVAQGTYPSGNIFDIKGNAIVIGGFAGIGFSDPNQRDVNLYPTVFSQQICDDCYGQMLEISPGSNVVLDGLGFDSASKLAILCSESTLDIRNCTFTNNRTGISFGTGKKDDRLILTNCVFAMNGTAVSSSYSASSSASETLIQGCRFASNVGAISAGRIPLTIIDSVFMNNASAIDARLQSLENLIIQDSRFIGHTETRMIDVSSPFILFSNCLFSGNQGGSVFASNSFANITQCTFADNRGPGLELGFSRRGEVLEERIVLARITNSIFFDNGDTDIAEYGVAAAELSYCTIPGGWPGEGNLNVDPCFVAPGYWDDNSTPDDPNDDVFIEGDYHLKSRAGHWDTISETWIKDDTTSQCIDAGDPNSPVGTEPFPNGGIVNMGAYGGTSQASKTDIR